MSAAGIILLFLEATRIAEAMAAGHSGMSSAVFSAASFTGSPRLPEWSVVEN